MMSTITKSSPVLLFLLSSLFFLVMIKSGSSFLLSPVGLRRAGVWDSGGFCSLWRTTPSPLRRVGSQSRYHQARITAAVLSAASSSSSSSSRKRGEASQPNPPKFLTADDLDRTQRVYYSELSDYEDDVDRMAASYNPEEDDFLPEQDMTDENENENEMPQKRTKHKESIRHQSSSPFTTISEQQMTENVAEPRSPLSFISIIADPSPPDEEEPKWQVDFFGKTTSANNKKAKPIPSDEDDEETSSHITDWKAASSRLPAPNVRSASQLNYVSEESSLSAEEFRAKYTFQPVTTDVPTILVDEMDASQLQPSMPPALQTSRRQDVLYELERDLKRLDKEITTANNGKAFNLGSYKQISQALFGTPDQSVSKSVLEGMAVSSILAKLILEHRQVKQRYNKIKQQQDSAQQKQERQTVSTSNSRNDDNVEPLILVDTSSFIFRAYFSMPPMHRSDGLPISAVLGFCNMLNRMVMTPLLNGKQPRLVLCCDAPSPASGGPKTIRHELYDQYKAHRPEAPMDLIPQFPLVRMAAQAYGMLWVEAPGYEADDVIASLSRMALEEGLSVHIYSGDKDLMQLITNSSTAEGLVKMIDPMTMTHWEHDAVVEKWGVAAHQLGDVLALAGDSADNIPGVPGIGPKIAAQLVQQFGSLEELLANLDQVPQPKRRETLKTYRDQAILSQQLVTLIRDLSWDAMTIDPLTDDQSFFPPPERVGDLRMAPFDPDRILSFYEAMGFVTIKEKIIERLRRQSKIDYNYQSSPPSKTKSKAVARKRIQVPKPTDFDGVPF